jgi:hypothetical protein
MIFIGKIDQNRNEAVIASFIEIEEANNAITQIVSDNSGDSSILHFFFASGEDTSTYEILGYVDPS